MKSRIAVFYEHLHSRSCQSRGLPYTVTRSLASIAEPTRHCAAGQMKQISAVNDRTQPSHLSVLIHARAV